MAEPPDRRLHCFRLTLSLRGLMLAVLVLGGGLGWYVANARKQAETVALIRNLGGTVRYDWEYRDGKNLPAPRASSWPAWLMDRIGPDYLGHVTMVSFYEPFDRYDPRIVDWLRALPRLEVIDNLFHFPSQSDLAALSRIDHLKQVELCVVDAEPIDLSPLAKLKRLEQLDLTLPSIDGNRLEFLSHLGQLKELYLYSDQICDNGLAPLQSLTNLEALTIQRNNYDPNRPSTLKISSEGLSHLASMRRLETLYIGDIQIQNLSAIASLTSLREFGFDLGPTDAAGLAPLSRLRNLETLSITESKITDQGLAALSKLTRLKELSLGSDAITDEGLVHLGGLSNLEDLDLSSNNITDAGLAQIARLSKLEYLSLKNVCLTEAAIVPLSQLKACKAMDLFGSIPESVLVKLRAKLPQATIN